MKQAFALLALIFLIATCTKHQNKGVERNMIHLLQNQKYFELRNVFNEYKHVVDEQISLQVEAFLLNTFNQNSLSNQKIDNLINNYQLILTDSLKGELLILKADNYHKLFEYNKAYEVNNEFLQKYTSSFDSAKIADVNNMQKIFEPLINIAPQKVIINTDNIIPITRDAAGLMNVNVSLKDSTYSFIFDTGAGMPVIKRSFAEQLGIKMLETNIDVNSATGIVVKSSLAVIDSLSIGNILVLNSVFLVLEDYMLEFPQINYFPDAAIGFPIMEEFKEFTISKDDTLYIPLTPNHSEMANMRLNGLSPNVYLYNGKDTLEYAFDTGATKCHFTSDYYNKYKEEITAMAQLDTITTGSAGGMLDHEAYKLDSTSIFIGDNMAVLKGSYVHTNHMETFKDVYGNLGQDLIKQFNSMTLNFEDMYMKFD